MGLDLRKSEVHVRPRLTNKLRIDAPPDQKFRCFRCRRRLPEDQFCPVGHDKKHTILYLHPFCKRCRRQLKCKWASHRLVTPWLQTYVKKSFTSIKGGAIARGIALAITEDDIYEMYVDQGGKCAVTGQKLTYRSNDSRQEAWQSLSVDRIDSSGNYTRDNVHLVCRVVNLMKNDMAMDQFMTWCRRVANGGD